MSKLAVLVDGSGFIYRAYYALPPLTTADGTPVGAVYGFCSMLLSLLEKHQSDLFFVALDSGRQTFRADIYSEYKANRSETPDDLKSQFNILREACTSFGVTVIEKKGFEADDIIATYSSILSQKCYDVRIISSDKDLMQLISDNVCLFDPIKSRLINRDAVIERYGVIPEQMTSLQALMGDSTDNIPGVVGIGPKTAAKLLNEYGSLENIYKNIENIKQPKLRSNLINEKEKLDISLRLVTLRNDLDVDSNLENLKVMMDINRTSEFLSKYKFDSLIKRLNKNYGISISKNRKKISVSSVNELENFFELNRVRKFSLFCTTISANTAILALCIDKVIAYCSFSLYVENNLFEENTGLSSAEVSNVLKKYFAKSDILKIGLNGVDKYFSNADINSYDDIAMIAYLLYGPAGDSVGNIFKNYPDDICKLSFKKITDLDHICRIAELAYDQYDSMISQLREQNLLTVYYHIEKPVARIINNMQRVGIKVSVNELMELFKEFTRKIAELEEKIYELCGCKFNIGSVKQLSDVLFNKLRIPHPTKNNLDIESLEELAIYSDIPALVIEWRKVSKLVSNYTHSLCKLVSKNDGRLHTTFNTFATVTGRLSSSNPNLQNIPARTDLGKRIKKAFISKEGYKLLSFDYSQIELRLLAHIADVKLLKDSFLNGNDVHAVTASEVFGVKLDDVTSQMRTYAKAINFGIIYGMSPYGLARMLKVSIEKAKEYIKHYFTKIPEFTTFKLNTLEFSRRNGYVTTVTGRRCYIRDIMSKNYQLRSFSERQAVNAVIQGSAADIVKLAMIKADSISSSVHSEMLLQIHDELVFETQMDYVEKAIYEIKQTMEGAYQLSVPLIVNSECGDYLQ